MFDNCNVKNTICPAHSNMDMESKRRLGRETPDISRTDSICKENETA